MEFYQTVEQCDRAVPHVSTGLTLFVLIQETGLVPGKGRSEFICDDHVVQAVLAPPPDTYKNGPIASQNTGVNREISRLLAY